MPFTPDSPAPLASNERPSPDAVSARVEELLREQLEELGESPAELSPEAISAHMRCEVFPDQSMVYAWKDLPILRVVPERSAEGVVWRMFTRECEE